MSRHRRQRGRNRRHSCQLAVVTDGGADISDDAPSIPGPCRNSIQSVPRGGQHVEIGLQTAAEETDIVVPVDHVVLKEIDIVSSVGRQLPRYDERFRMVETGKVDPSAVVAETVALEDVSGKLEAMTGFQTVGIPVVDSF